MKLRTLILFLLLGAISSAQVKTSKGDILFFEYDFKAAIKQYQLEMRKSKLSNQQFLNLADSYFKTDEYAKSAEIYLDVFKRDTTMSNAYFNKMLQALSKTKGRESVATFLETRKREFPVEILENYDFNNELLKAQSESDIEVLNLRTNSAQADFSPSFYEDRLLFTSARNENIKEKYAPSGESYMDIMIGRIEKDGDVLVAQSFDNIPETIYHEATPYYSKELKSTFYILSNADGDELSFDKNGRNALSMGMVDQNGNFKFLLRDLSTSFYYPFFEYATGRLFFAANFPEGYGGTDIYYVYTNDGQIMSSPINLGPRINTAGNEIAPYIYENSLYFSSDIFYGLGGMDVYKANMKSNNNFSIPVNLGIGINTSSDDFGLIIRENGSNGLMGYFASNRAGGKGNDDIYSFHAKQSLGLKTFAVKGKVINLATNQGIQKAKIRLLDKDGVVIKELYANEEGDYSVEIPFQNVITIEASKDRHSTYLETYQDEKLESLQKNDFNPGVLALEDVVEEKENQTVLKLRKFYFGKGRSTITPEIAMELDKVVVALTKFPKLQLRIETHTDSRGSNSYNLKLSQERSEAIKRYLLQNGVSADNILFTVGFGEEKITNNCTNGVFCLDMLHQQNERTLLVVLNYKTIF
ncbi:cell envelope biogenesis protein OmpA [Sediminicola sp. YIK13]|uniref:OmpA family protein n=1 Tax=Sediminicola sp. YIK13 TaxID=1453352 RepID=UPI0007219E60|nr:OmpA family protein [Sediminicola sp. YIK13]ALM08940.1 cell envelope biogenesis protein OmpA [Sediminicola sp. YIK13]